MDNFITLSNRLLNRCPAIGINLSQQFINDSWRTLQARRTWSFRRRGNTFAPPTVYQTGFASTNVANNNPFLITFTNDVDTTGFVGRQIRVGGLLYPFYTIKSLAGNSPPAVLIDQPWAGPDVTAVSYQVLQSLYSVPDDFGYFYTVVSIKDGYKLWLNLTEADLAIMDPQRTNFGQTYAAVFKGYTPQYSGSIGATVCLTNSTSPVPLSGPTVGYTYPGPTSFVIQIVSGGIVGAATYQVSWSGNPGFGSTLPTDVFTDIGQGVGVNWVPGTYVSGDIYTIACTPLVTSGTPLYELWPAPTFSGYLYPYIYISKEYDLTVQNPTLPPFIANRGEVLLEMGLEKCAEFPGQDADHLNIYHDLKQAMYHANKVKDLLIDLERNDEEVGVSLIDYEQYPFAPAPWMDGQWQQTHAPFLG